MPFEVELTLRNAAF